MLNNAEFDHLVIAVPDLQKYVEQCEGRLGVGAVDGGAHPGLGTANALLGLELGDDLTESLGLARQRGANPLTYLEILGPDPAQPDVSEKDMLLGVGPPLSSGVTSETTADETREENSRAASTPVA